MKDEKLCPHGQAVGFWCRTCGTVQPQEEKRDYNNSRPAPHVQSSIWAYINQPEKKDEAK